MDATKIDFPARDKEFISDIYDLVFDNPRHSHTRADFETPQPIECPGGIGWTIRLKSEMDVFVKKGTEKVEFRIEPEKNGMYHVYKFPNSDLRPSGWFVESTKLYPKTSEQYFSDEIVIWIENMEKQVKAHEKFIKTFYNSPKVEFEDTQFHKMGELLSVQQIEITKYIIQNVEDVIVKHGISPTEFRKLREDFDKKLTNKPTYKTLKDIYDVTMTLLNTYIALKQLPQEVIVNINGGFNFILNPLGFIIDYLPSFHLMMKAIVPGLGVL